MIEERDALNSNALVRSYVWQPEVLDRDVPLTVYDAVAEKTYYYHSDANKNVTELSDENGEVIAHYEYSPFGSLTMVTGNYAENNPFRFSSEYFDEETGLVYYNYRYYNPELGRWISRDPIEEQGGYNLYSFINNNGIVFYDIHGLDTFSLDRELNPFNKTNLNPVNSVVSHTFVYTTNADGSLKNTYSWGNTYTDDKKGNWHKNSPEDISAARKAIENKKFWDSLPRWVQAMFPEARPPMGFLVGDEALDDYIDFEFSEMQNDESLKHRWQLFNNCKHEAANLIKRAREAQQKNK